MAFVVVAASLAQLLDLATFAGMVSRLGPGAEGNPIVASLLVDHGLPFVAVSKIVALGLIVAAIAVLGRRDRGAGHPRLAVSVGAVVVAMGLIGGWTNLAALV